MDNYSFFKKIYLGALTPFELLRHEERAHFIFDHKESAFYIEEWKRNISRDRSSEAFGQYCIANDLSEADILMMTSRIKDTTKKLRFPSWINTLEETLDYPNNKYPTQKNKQPKQAFYELLAPFIDFFEVKIRKKLSQLDETFIDKSIIPSLSEKLYECLFRISHLTFLEAFSIFKKETVQSEPINLPEDFYYKKFVTDILTHKFQQLFIDYPILARRLATKTQGYLKFINNILGRLSTDKSEIEYFFNIKLDVLSQLHLDSGDQHNGESTVILHFKNGSKLVYKPTSVAITNAYNSFLEWINTKLGESLRSFQAINKEEYGWLEYVNHDECKTVRDVKMYYERAGLLLGIAYFLNARDYHFENVIANGNCPILIDHETIVGHKIKSYSHPQGRNPENNILDTILESHLLPIGKKDIPSYYCGFGSSVQFEYSNTIRKIKNSNKDDMQQIPQIMSEQAYKLNKPKLNNRIENLVDYQSEFKRGFHKLYNLILEHNAFLVSENSPLIQFKDAKVRFINRITKVYFKILQVLTKPEYLSDATKYGLKMEVLARAYTSLGKWSPILNSERTQLLAGDIPVFYTDTAKDHLVLPNGQIVDVFEFNAIESVNNKIRKASLQDYHYQLDVMEGVIAL